MENREYVFKVQELLDIVEELCEVCVKHNLNIATKDYLCFEVEYDYKNSVSKLTTYWNYKIDGSTDEELVDNLKKEYTFLVEEFSEDVDFSDILKYKVKGE